MTALLQIEKFTNNYSIALVVRQYIEDLNKKKRAYYIFKIKGAIYAVFRHK
jgi:hypothetical protein